MPVGAVGRETVIGVAQESTYGTPVTVSKFYEFLSEGFKITRRELESNGMRPSLGGSRQAKAGRRTSSRGHTVEGSLEIEVPSNGLGFWLRNMLGAPTVAGVQQGATTAYKHTFTSGPLNGKSFTFQKALRQSDGTEVSVHTYPGSKITSATFSASPGEVLKLAMDMVAQKELTDVVAATPVYLDDLRLFSWDDGKLFIEGVEVATVSAADIAIANELDTERDHLGNGGTIAEPIDTGLNALGVSGSLTYEFYDKTVLYDAYKNRTPLELVLSFTGDNIASTFDEALVFTVPQVILGGDTPVAGGPEIITVDVPWMAEHNGDDESITIEYTTTDVTV